MKILLTGASGFLGKKVLELLLNDHDVQEVIAISRTHSTHPDPRVKLLNIDLVKPECLDRLKNEMGPVDCVVHLAGLYSFTHSFTELYQANVLPTLHLLEWLEFLAIQNPKKPVPMIFASTYAVGYGSSHHSLKEAPLEELPPQNIPYAYTKAVAEIAVTNAKTPTTVLRLGVIVGNQEDGEIERLDGPYFFLSLLQKISKNSFIKRLPTLPIPANPKALLPLVPVEIAAQAFVQVIKHPLTYGVAKRVYGVYNSESVTIEEFCKTAFEEFHLSARPSYALNVSRNLLKIQSKVSKIPSAIFQFSGSESRLETSTFERDFPEVKIPHFHRYSTEFYKGFRTYVGDPS